MPMWLLCAQLCSRIQICKSINFIARTYTCQINDAEPVGKKDELLKSVGNSFVAASSLQKELAGPCKGHDCKVNEVCIPQSPTYACVKLLEVIVENRTREGSLVSQFKKTGQSTSFDCIYELCEAGAGVDGIKGPYTIFHTESELEPFWWVTRTSVQGTEGGQYKSDRVLWEGWSITIIATLTVHVSLLSNEPGDRLRKMLVHVGKSLDTSHMDLCGQFLGPAVNGQVIVIKCCTFLEGQIVKLTSVNNAPTPFHLTEVEVYGF
ncbi:unnamed protein product [Mytilus coruscus]|uniref:Fucolectin tachylectin-4 pentraxin-1 domain-containing protein n=1 Tax=Mytilus coruscus TaxID=42192 RepID=A0A6J8C6Z4_MYTCO|nr:unnamed protein product [Mytilus coruscus]